MAHLKASPNNPIISKRLFRGSASSRSIKCSKLALVDWKSCKIVGYYGRNDEKRRFLERQRGVVVVVDSCSSSTTSSTQEIEFVDNGKCEVSEGEFGYLVEEFGWKVRRLVEEEDEMNRVAQLQAEAFHVPVVVFNDLFFQFFEAEVLSGLLYKLRNSPPNRYACLVAEPTDVSTSLPVSQQEIVGVVDVTALRDKSVLMHLEGADEYLYVSGIAVSKDFRRQKVATVLLKACDLLSLLWGFDYLALRAYEDDLAARTLYTNAGYRVVSGDPPWMTTWMGRKRRILMIKQSALRDWF